MAYYISYDDLDKKGNKIADKRGRRLILTFLCFCFFLLLVKLFWREGNYIVNSILLPRDMEVVDVALKIAIRDVENGQSLPTVIQSLYQRIIHEAFWAG